jgi:hypothetical protein
MININDIFVGEIVRVKNSYGGYVKVHVIDKDNRQVYCTDEVLGMSTWYDIDNLEKLTANNTSKENDDMDNSNINDEFLAFVEALKTIVEFNGIDVPQVEVDEEPNVVDNDYDDFDLNFDDYEDDLLDEKYDGNRSPDYKFNFYSALEELHFQYVNEDRNVIWYMTNNERTLTFKDDRLVDVRLAEHIENLVYFSAPIHVEDLLDEWEVRYIVDEETAKVSEIIKIAESLKDKALMLDLLDIISKYVE